MHNHWDIKFNTIRRKDNKNREHKGTVLLCFFVFKTIINHFLYARSPLRVRISSVNNNKNPNGLDASFLSEIVRFAHGEIRTSSGEIIGLRLW